YYTGTIIEVKAKDVEIGSITGGGRYDNLTGVFGQPGLSGVGISFGADRIYDVLNQLNLYPKEISSAVRVMFVNFGEREAAQARKYVAALRKSGISAQLYPDSAKMKKQMSLANSEGVPFVAIIGEDELADSTVTLKNMSSGEQERLTIEQVIERVK
ncbi:MAG: ATP phosphoribosyltransferase regulatory subunit, partial [Muribaculaceae bacterium]|nr:ATP phosphoribosyltransferase regulatory subunit [Muribaculaceae bacterium]